MLYREDDIIFPKIFSAGNLLNKLLFRASTIELFSMFFNTFPVFFLFLMTLVINIKNLMISSIFPAIPKPSTIYIKAVSLEKYIRLLFCEKSSSRILCEDEFPFHFLNPPSLSDTITPVPQHHLSELFLNFISLNLILRQV
jgi:hypothetical protein